MLLYFVPFDGFYIYKKRNWENGAVLFVPFHLHRCKKPSHNLRYKNISTESVVGASGASGGTSCYCYE